jgi:uncharacterized protein YciU (UPF0263 family)
MRYLILALFASTLACGNRAEFSTEVTKTRTTCTAENVIPGISPEIDLKFIINLNNGERATLLCMVLNHETKATLALTETAYDWQDTCSVDFAIEGETVSNSQWVMTDGATTNYANYLYSATDYDEMAVVFDTANCVTENAD